MDEMNVGLSMFSSGVASVYAIELLKRIKSIPFVDEQSRVLNRWLGVIASGLATVGIGFTFDSQAGTLLITGISLATIAQTAWHWFTQWALQQVLYQSAFEKRTVTITVPDIAARS